MGPYSLPPYQHDVSYTCSLTMGGGCNVLLIAWGEDVRCNVLLITWGEGVRCNVLLITLGGRRGGGYLPGKKGIMRLAGSFVPASSGKRSSSSHCLRACVCVCEGY